MTRKTWKVRGEPAKREVELILMLFVAATSCFSRLASPLWADSRRMCHRPHVSIHRADESRHTIGLYNEELAAGDKYVFSAIDDDPRRRALEPFRTKYGF